MYTTGGTWVECVSCSSEDTSAATQWTGDGWQAGLHACLDVGHGQRPHSSAWRRPSDRVARREAWTREHMSRLAQHSVRTHTHTTMPGAPLAQGVLSTIS
eukprot:8369824-Alexandrium_andersonii.AAC.1